MAEHDSIVTCTNNTQDIWELLASVFGVDGTGKFYIRTVEYAQQAAEGDAVACGGTIEGGAEATVMDLLRKSIVENSEGKPALRLGTI